MAGPIGFGASFAQIRNRIAAGILCKRRMSLMGHVWTAPWQELF